ncbi:MAG: TetR family transcriptional regulator [Akkermansiaceae bacterium]|nr:TetR family transcriptional regulator [Akkermansiaceae bacterium]
MGKKEGTSQRREESLSRERIIEASIELLDSLGEAGLTFRALSERLATGPGAIYWHIASKRDLLIAACDAVVARTVDGSLREAGAAPEATLRALALGMFDTMAARPWVGSALIQAPGQLPMVRIFEGIGQQVCALGVPPEDQWATASALLHYVLGVGGQHAANTQLARTHGLDRSGLLEGVSSVWSRLEPADYPFARSVAAQLPLHDDRVDFLTGIDLILGGIRASRPGGPGLE